MEAAAGLPAPTEVPASTPTTLTYRVLATIASTAIRSVHPIDIQPGYIDTSGYGGGPNEALESFSSIDEGLLLADDHDFNGLAGYRFWIVVRDEEPVLALEQREGLAWTLHHAEPFSVMGLYEKSRRDVVVTALKLFRRVD